MSFWDDRDEKIQRIIDDFHDDGVRPTDDMIEQEYQDRERRERIEEDDF